MTAIEVDELNQDAVLFMSEGYGNYGNAYVTASNCKDIKVRWEHAYEEQVDNDGNTVAIEAIVVVDQQITKGSFLWKGKRSQIASTGYVPSSDVMQVFRYTEVPDIKNRHTRRLVYLRRYNDTLPTS